MAESTGLSVGVDTIDGANHQLVKLELGDDGTATQISSSNLLPMTSVPSVIVTPAS